MIHQSTLKSLSSWAAYWSVCCWAACFVLFCFSLRCLMYLICVRWHCALTAGHSCLPSHGYLVFTLSILVDRLLTDARPLERTVLSSMRFGTKALALCYTELTHSAASQRQTVLPGSCSTGAVSQMPCVWKVIPTPDTHVLGSGLWACITVL